MDSPDNPDLYTWFYCFDCKLTFVASGSAPLVAVKCNKCKGTNIDSDAFGYYRKLFHSRGGKTIKKKKPKPPPPPTEYPDSTYPDWPERPFPFRDLPQ